MADKEIAALNGAHLRCTRFVYVAASFAALGDLLFWKKSKPSGEQGMVCAKQRAEFPNSIARDYAVSPGPARGRLERCESD